jgi:hypothetical protein
MAECVKDRREKECVKSPALLDAVRTQRARVRGFAQARLGDAFAAGIVVEDPFFVAGPDREVLQLPWAEGLEEQPTRLAFAGDHRLMQWSLTRIEVVSSAQDDEHMVTKFVQRRQRGNVSHT